MVAVALGAGKVEVAKLPPAATRAVNFERDVRPIFSAACVSCHGAEKQKSDYRLDERASALRGGSIGGAIVPGDSAGSLLIAYVAGAHDEVRMPPKGAMLSGEQVGVLRAWIDQGAKWPETVEGATPQAEHWALRRLVTPVVPKVVRGEWVRTPIDAFLLAKLEEKKLRPSAEADRRTLIRRVTFDLTGLPPTPREVEAFLSDASADAYERVVDRLLASPRYGERWARHWMDVVHYAETHGHDEDKPRPNAWPYRDYLIRAFNADRPYARFVEEQLAGDVLWPDDPEAVVGAAFNAVGPWDQSSQMGIQDGTLDKQAARYLDRDDMLSTAMSTFVSATVHCARCHNHKFDPISQADYYALQAVFAGVDRIDRPYDADAKVLAERRRLTGEKAALAAGTYPVERLLSADAAAKVAEWEGRRAALAGSWKTAETLDAISANGATLTKQADGSILSSGERPDKDTYVVTARSALPRVTAVRVEVMTDLSLPHNGPGRAVNGNLHLSDFMLSRLGPDGAASRVAVKRATADFDQEGWGVAGALDGKAETSWGIHPQEGRPHLAVFELAGPVEVKDGERLAFFIEQRQGGGHLIGRVRLSATDAVPPVRVEKLPEDVATAALLEAARRTDEQRAALARHVLAEDVDRALGALPPQQQIYTIASDFEAKGNYKPAKKPRPVHVLRRGDVRQPLEPATPGALSCVPGLEGRFKLDSADDEGARRAALARWVSARENVLTWRSIVNRVWHYHFGRGIVETPSDFGRMGATPTHPELLDWLAVTFRDEFGGSLKRLHRLIVTSAAYRQSSAHDAACAAVDGDNRYLWRMNRARLDAESVRDAILAVSGRLDLTMHGPSVKQFVETKGVHETPNADYAGFDVDGPGARRRSVYRFVFRTVPDPFMQTFDCPDASQWAPRREESVTPLQALSMRNNRFVVRNSEHLAERAKAAGDVAAQVAALYRLVLNCAPTAGEAADVAAYAGKHGLANAARVLLNSNEFMFVD
jgi:cytochrome c553